MAYKRFSNSRWYIYWTCGDQNPPKLMCDCGDVWIELTMDEVSAGLRDDDWDRFFSSREVEFTDTDRMDFVEAAQLWLYDMEKQGYEYTMG